MGCKTACHQVLRGTSALEFNEEVSKSPPTTTALLPKPKKRNTKGGATGRMNAWELPQLTPGLPWSPQSPNRSTTAEQNPAPMVILAYTVMTRRVLIRFKAFLLFSTSILKGC